jgi:hypothetical protein
MYSHSFTPKKANPERWNRFIEECRLLKASLPMYSESAGGYYNDKKILIRGGLGTGKANFNKRFVWFNGDQKRELSSETFWTTPDLTRIQWCKTDRKPYDLLVCAVLIAAHNILGYEVTSNGNLKDWKPAIEFYSDIIYGVPILKFDDNLKKFVLPKFLYKETLKN